MSGAARNPKGGVGGAGKGAGVAVPARRLQPAQAAREALGTLLIEHLRRLCQQPTSVARTEFVVSRCKPAASLGARKEGERAGAEQAQQEQELLEIQVVARNPAQVVRERRVVEPLRGRQVRGLRAQSTQTAVAAADHGPQTFQDRERLRPRQTFPMVCHGVTAMVAETYHTTAQPKRGGSHAAL